jgi:hypothetical protein
LKVNLYGTENWKLLTVDWKYLESFEMWCWGRMEKIVWTDRVENEDIFTWGQGEEEHLSNNKKKKY